MQRYRKDGDCTYALGTELSLEVLKRRPQDVLSVYVHSRQKENDIFHEVLSLCHQHSIKVIRSDKAFNIVNAKENCYIMALFRKFTNPIVRDSNHVVLVNPSNMGNLGSIIRTMVGFGIYDLAVITPAADIFDPKVIRATMRAFFLLRFSLYSSFEEYLKENSDRTVYPFMLDGKTRLQDIRRQQPYSLVFGNEAVGLDGSYQQYDSVFIEQLDTVDSLNLNNAVSIAAYEFNKDKVK